MLASCAGGPKGDISYAPPEFTGAASTARGSAQEAYRISPEDTVEINVFKVPDLSGKYTVGKNGRVDLPLIGDVAASGATEAELARELERRYSGRFLVNPSIQIRVIATNSAKLVLDGAVRRPGVYNVSGNTTLIEAIALGNGLDPATANPRRVIIVRKIDGETYRAAFDIDQVREGLMPNPQIIGGDIVVVDGSNLRSDVRDLLSTVPLIALFLREL